MAAPLPSKAEMRRELREIRGQQVAKDAMSLAICEKLSSLSAYQTAQVVMAYVHARSEVRTESLIRELLAEGKTVVIPYCDGDDLIPWRLTDWSELAIGAFGILEPRAELRNVPQRRIEPVEIDLICVPGLAFDRAGNRLGSGRGYYDRLLPLLRDDAIKVGLAYECQIVPQLPTEPHDVPMDLVITEAN